MNCASRVVVLAALVAASVLPAIGATFEEGTNAPSVNRIDTDKSKPGAKDDKGIQQTLASASASAGIGTGDSVVQRNSNPVVQVANVPEPQSYGMYALGLILMASVAMRRLTRTSQALPLSRR